MNDDRLQRLVDKDAIRDVIYRYCRGLDRMDKELAYSVFLPDCQVEYFDVFEGSGHGFIDWVWETHAEFERHAHQISNCLIEVDGDSATSEAYVTVTLWTLPGEDGKQLEIVSRNRYVDNWRRAGDGWAIAHRQCIADLQTIAPLTRGDVNAESRRDTQDASYRLFG